jgi:hypothetical protein
MLKSEQTPGIDPIMDDFKKEQEKLRAKPVY